MHLKTVRVYKMFISVQHKRFIEENLSEEDLKCVNTTICGVCNEVSG